MGIPCETIESVLFQRSDKESRIRQVVVQRWILRSLHFQSDSCRVPLDFALEESQLQESHVLRFADETGQSIGNQIDHFDADHCGHHQEVATFIEYDFGEL